MVHKILPLPTQPCFLCIMSHTSFSFNVCLIIFGNWSIRTPEKKLTNSKTHNLKTGLWGAFLLWLHTNWPTHLASVSYILSLLLFPCTVPPPYCWVVNYSSCQISTFIASKFLCLISSAKVIFRIQVFIDVGPWVELLML